MRKRNLSIGLLFVVLLAPLTVPAQQPATAAVASSLVLTTDLDHVSVVLSPADFRSLPHVTITVHNGHSNAAETYSGVPLATTIWFRLRCGVRLSGIIRKQRMESKMGPCGTPEQPVFRVPAGVALCGNEDQARA